jgi:hypothetical protein
MKKLFVILFVMSVVLVSCAPYSQTQAEREQAVKDSSTGAIYEIKNFLERRNINTRQELFDNPAQVSWIYCLGETGTVVFYGEVVGKVTSSTKRLEPISTTGSDYNAAGSPLCYSGICTNEVMQQDGTFGNSDAYVYWYDSAGNYYQWDGLYFLTSVPIKVNESVLNMRSVDSGGQ